jgi:hypothetical protein
LLCIFSSPPPPPTQFERVLSVNQQPTIQKNVFGQKIHRIDPNSRI